MSLRLPDPGSFEDLLRPIRIEVASLVRLSRHPATEPYWSAGVYRFDDPDPGGAGPYGTCYTASTIAVASAESVIHECGRFVRGSYEVPAAELTERSVVRFVCDRRKTLVLADLTGAALKALGLNNDISASADYTASQAWARAIHSASPRWDGIRYVSRQMNQGFAYAIFERGGLRKLRADKLTTANKPDLFARVVYDFSKACVQIATPDRKQIRGVLFTTLFSRNIRFVEHLPSVSGSSTRSCKRRAGAPQT